jgi:hypothetical protein
MVVNNFILHGCKVLWEEETKIGRWKEITVDRKRNKK